ncbi:hypothetical protein [Amycolatopsis sp. cmx-11-32]|uniref:hypothetical protein n=1 Tax=Amycolatopsis sp. cmx-11-32 TaxID=2785796 RepID=UPI0039E23193
MGTMLASRRLRRSSSITVASSCRRSFLVSQDRPHQPSQCLRRRVTVRFVPDDEIGEPVQLEFPVGFVASTIPSV